MASLPRNDERTLLAITESALRDGEPDDLLDTIAASIGATTNGDGLLVLAEYLARPDRLAAPSRFPELAHLLRSGHAARQPGAEGPILNHLVDIGEKAVLAVAPKEASAENVARAVVVAVLNAIENGISTDLTEEPEPVEALECTWATCEREAVGLWAMEMLHGQQVSVLPYCKKHGEQVEAEQAAKPAQGGLVFSSAARALIS